MFPRFLKRPFETTSAFTWANAYRMCSDHLSRTGNNFRQNLITEAYVKDVAQLSSSVKRVTLKVQDSNFTFFAGQWVDVFIPGVNQIGGFSMCSSPTILNKSLVLQLAVKSSSSPPAKWVHEQCKPGDKLQLRVGGDVYYTIPDDGQQMPDLLLIAGGVGINPLWSILLELKDQKVVNHHEGLPKKVFLLYSSRNSDELLFKNNLSKLRENLGNCFDFKLFTTQQKLGDTSNSDPNNLLETLNERRIQAHDIKDALNSCDKSNMECFLCGPSNMIDDCRAALLSLGLPDVSIKYEKWW